MIIYKNTKINDLRTPSQKTPFDFASIGYTGNEEPMKSDLAYSLKIKNEWDANQTDLSSKFSEDNKLKYFPEVDFSKIINLNSSFNLCRNLATVKKMNSKLVEEMSSVFERCELLNYIGELNTESVKNFDKAFYGCGNLKYLPTLNLQNCTNLSSTFYGCKLIEKINLINTQNITSYFGAFKFCSSLNEITLNISSANSLESTFEGCGSLKKVNLIGDTSHIQGVNGMFGYSYSSSKLPSYGKLTYDHRYDYTKIIDELKTVGPKWEIKNDYEPKECINLTITGDDVIGNERKTIIHYKAITNGVYTFNNENAENIELTGDIISEPFDANPSYTDSREITISFTYLNKTATATIVQGPKQHPSVNPILTDKIKISETLQSFDPQIYSEIYETVNTTNYSHNFLKIEFIGCPNFELYLNYDSYNYGGVRTGFLDSADLLLDDELYQYQTESSVENGGVGDRTVFNKYKKIVYPNDGGKHFIYVDFYTYYADDKEAIFFKKPVE